MYFEVKKKVQSDISCVNETVSELLLDIYHAVGEEHKFNIKLILSELLINGIKHGNHFDKNKFVYMNILINNNAIHIQVTDEGKGINYNGNYNPHNNFSSSGRGLVLVEGLSDKLIIKGNTVTVIKYL